MNPEVKSKDVLLYDLKPLLRETRCTTSHLHQQVHQGRVNLFCSFFSLPSAPHFGLCALVQEKDVV